MTGLDFETVHFTELDFTYVYDRYSPYSKEGVIVALQLDCDDNVLKGRPRLMSAAYGLGLVLTWTSTCGPTMVLELIFGMTQMIFWTIWHFVLKFLSCLEGQGRCQNQTSHQ